MNNCKATHVQSRYFATGDAGANPNYVPTMIGNGTWSDDGCYIIIAAKPKQMAVLDFVSVNYKVNTTAVAHPMVYVSDAYNDIAILAARTLASGDGADSITLEYTNGFPLVDALTWNLASADREDRPASLDTVVGFINGASAGATSATAPITTGELWKLTVGYHYEQMPRNQHR